MMRVSLEWLKEYVELAGLRPDEIAEALTNSGLEVESIDYSGPRFDGVVVAKVLTVEPHPNADKLRLVTVDLGAAQTRVVCGAPNVREGIFIAFAQEGATVISRKDGAPFKLDKAVIRGVESAGMICSLAELGLETRFEKAEDGIWPLDTVSAIEWEENHLGQDLKTALSLEADAVLHVAPTANRGDLMSVIGVAREISALFDRPLHGPRFPHLVYSGTEKLVMKISLSDPEVCRYYAGALMRKLKIAPSPDWMVRRLQAAGVRSINNVVDITNYVMLEMGQPLHAFDLDKLGASGLIDVRRARANESLTTLDDVERSFTENSVLITMNNQPVALAGLMGGASTEIDDQSVSLFLESACFQPAAIRKSSKSVNLRSEASARFERGVDIGQTRNALLRAIQLLQQHAGAELAHIVESPTPAVQKPRLTLHFQRVEKILGLSIPSDVVINILKRLGYLLEPTKEVASLVVTVPSFRQEDVYREIDLIEEVIRIYGYDKVPYTLPKKTGTSVVSLRARTIDALGEALRGQGLQEVVTTSLIGQSLLDKTGFHVDQEQLVTVLNSHSTDHTIMRQSLLPNIIEIAKFNQAQGAEQVWIYELGRAYFKLGKPNAKNSGVAERLHLAGLITGSSARGEWRRKEPADFYLLKGMLESLFTELGLSDRITFQPSSDVAYLHPGKTATVMLGSSNDASSSPEQKSKALGVLGQLHPHVQSSMKFRQPVFIFELNVEAIYKALKQDKSQFQAAEVSQYPAIRRDMAFSAPVSIFHQDVLQALQKSEQPLLRHVDLFDEYRSEQLGEEQRSLAYRLTFQSDENTLTDAEVDHSLAQLKESLTNSLPVKFR
jgi:phenylalanyl-tRNA synthetase beta chain